MKKLKSIFTGIFIASILSLPLNSCKDYLDVNNNPNYPTDGTLATLLPSACATTIAQYGLNGVILGTMWLQHTTQGNSTNQYNTTVNYTFTTASYNAIWTNAYANTLPDLKLVIERAEKENAWNYWVIAKILTAYNFHMLTDLYEDIPYTEALQAEAIKQPKYDDSKSVVYPALLKMLDDAIAKESDATASSNPVLTKQDLFFKGVISKWIAFAKSLKLKIMMRDFNTYKTQISSLLSAGGLLEENCAVTTFEDATNKGNPLYEYNIRQLNTTENIRACHTLCEFLLNYSDPRIENIYELTAVASGKIAKGETLTYAQKYEGLPCGTKPPTSGNGSVPLTNSSKFKESFSDPVYLMNDAEAEFLIAEAYARIGDSGKAKTYYDKGVTKSFDRWKESASKASTFITDGGAYAFNASTTETMVKSIMTQKWISYAKANALDGVFDRNRTGYPSIDPSSVVRVSDSDRSKGLTSGYILGTLVAPGATTLQPSEFPRRLLVPDASAQYNVNAPKTKALGVPMWWQVASGK